MCKCLEVPLTIALAGVAASSNVSQPPGLPWIEHARLVRTMMLRRKSTPNQKRPSAPSQEQRRTTLAPHDRDGGEARRYVARWPFQVNAGFGWRGNAGIARPNASRAGRCGPFLSAAARRRRLPRASGGKTDEDRSAVVAAGEGDDLLGGPDGRAAAAIVPALASLGVWRVAAEQRRAQRPGGEAGYGPQVICILQWRRFPPLPSRCLCCGLVWPLPAPLSELSWSASSGPMTAE